MATTLTLSLTDAVEKFGVAFKTAEKSFYESASLYANAVRDHGEAAITAFSAKYPAVQPGTWRRLEAIGSGSMDIRLLTASSAGAHALRRLPIKIQTTALNEGVKVVSDDGSHLVVSVDNLTSEQVRQTMAHDHIRDLPEQVAWQEANAQPRTVSSKEQPTWKVRGGKVVVLHACTLTRLEIARMLVEIG